LALFAAWLLFLIIFIAIERTSSQPMISLSLFQNRLFSVNLVTGFITFICMAGTIILMPFYLENVLGYGPRSVGLLLATVPIAMGVAAPISGSLSDRYGTRPITVIGLLMLVVGFTPSALWTRRQPLAMLRFLPSASVWGFSNAQQRRHSPCPGAPGVARLLSITRTLGQTTISPCWGR
jgi:MFS family permease